MPIGEVVVVAVLLMVGIVATATDLQHRVIPNWLLAPAAVALAVAAVIFGHLWLSLLGAVALSIVAMLGAATGGLGMGDLKYLAVVGLGLGPLVGAVAVLVAAFGAVLWHLPAALRHGPAVRFPFGPFIAFGSVLTPLLWWAVLR